MLQEKFLNHLLELAKKIKKCRETNANSSFKFERENKKKSHNWNVLSAEVDLKKP